MGEELFEQITAATGLPNEVASTELGRLLAQAGLAKADLTLDDLRVVLAEYVQDILTQAKTEYSQPR